MPFGRLSPVSESVSETDTESLYTSRPVSGDTNPRSLNFSRPKPQDSSSSRNIQRDLNYAASNSSASSSTTAGSTRGGGAFYEPPTNDYPTEPRFESDSEQEGDADSIAPSTHSAGSDLVWDSAAGELRSQQASGRRNRDFEAQRYAAPAPRRSGNRSILTNDSAANDPELPLIPELPGDVPPPHIVVQQRQRQQQKEKERQRKEEPKQREDLKPTYHNFQVERAPRIVKSTSVEQQIEERANSLSSIHTAQTQTSLGRVAGWEDSRSNHTQTPSEHGDKQLSEWKSSEFDVSGLSEKKLAKLKKKGINPQLYMEMKAARGGKGKFVGPLVGNTYIG
ncbi:hypothetical protein Q7P35_001233 [Cladosporium inversicolor]